MLRWYETNRLDREVDELKERNFTVTITNDGFGDVIATRTNQEGDFLIHFPPEYPEECPRFLVGDGMGLPTHANGALDLHRLGITWNRQLTSASCVDAIDKLLSIDIAEESSTEGSIKLKNLTEALANRQDLACYGRDKQIEELMQCVLREHNAGSVLLGDAGVGKTSIVHQFIHEAAQTGAPPMLNSMIFYELRIEDIIASAKYRGDMERELKALLNRKGRLCLFIDELHRIASPQADGIADMLKPEMASGKVRVIGASTHAEWRAVKDAALQRRLEQINVPEPSPEETFLMIKPRVAKLQVHYGIDFPEEIIRTAIGLSHLYIRNKAFPGKAVDVLDRSAAAQVVSKFSHATPPQQKKEINHDSSQR
jgi:ATP-dependent Clp protease ATP-binding subunit ClpA